MNLGDLQRKLIETARRDLPSERVPDRFGQRVLAQIRRGRALADPWALWSQALWRALAPCVGVMLVFGAWFWLVSAGNPPATDLSQDFERTILATADAEPGGDLSQ